MKLTLREGSGDSPQVVVTGEITQREMPKTSDPLVSLIGEEGFRKQVVLDMADATYLDSSGVSWLLTCHKRFKQAGGAMVLKSLTPLVSNVVHVLKLEKVLHLADQDGNLQPAEGERP
jgi:anti-sigma B factor antagonist